MMKKNKKDNQKKFESIGAIEKAVRAMSSHRSVNAMEAVSPPYPLSPAVSLQARRRRMPVPSPWSCVPLKSFSALG